MKRKEHANTPTTGKSIAGPCHPKVKTQLTLNDIGNRKIHKSLTIHEVTQTQLEQDVVTVNPDINSMGSRG